MASRSILKNVKAPIHFLLRNPASSVLSRVTPPLAQTLQNLLVPSQNPHSAGEFSSFGVGELGLIDRPPLSVDLKSIWDGGFRIEARGKMQPVDDDDDDYQSDSNYLNVTSDDDGDDDGDDDDLGDFDDGDEE